MEEDSVLWEPAGGDGSAPVDSSSRVVAGEDVPGAQDDPAHPSATTDLFDLAGFHFRPFRAVSPERELRFSPFPLVCLSRGF